MNVKKIENKVVWFTGLSSSGKSTLASHLQAKLNEYDIKSCILDGDVIRSGLSQDLGFSLEEREENIRRASEVAKVLVESEIFVICSFISPSKKIRDLALSIIGREKFYEVFVNASLDVCIKRDVKGLYKKAMAGEIKEFTGISSPYETPSGPKLVLNTENLSVDDCVAELITNLKAKD